MIKIGKIKVNEKLGPNVFLACILLSFIIFLIFSINLASIFIKTKNYIKIKSIVTDVGYYTVHSSDNTYHYADVEYDYNGTHYHYRKTLHIFIFYPKIKSKINLYINPKMPTEVRDTWLTTIDIFVVIFSLIFHLFAIKFYLIRRKLNCN